MLVCERHNLYDAIIYIHNTAILDYISPAERMLSGLSIYVFDFMFTSRVGTKKPAKKKLYLEGVFFLGGGFNFF